MPIDFPNSPTNGQVFTDSGRTWVWNGTSWNLPGGSNSFALTTHSHGNLTSSGAIGSTPNLPVITTSSGVLTTGTFGTAANTFCQGNDSRVTGAVQNGGGAATLRVLTQAAYNAISTPDANTVYIIVG
jgi:hypothetical protein